jgi:hypothetical protein
MRLLCLSIALFVLAPLGASAAMSFESDGTRERTAFETVRMNQSTIDDATDDLTVFTRDGVQTVPEVMADITRVTMTNNTKRWEITVETATPLPDNPGMPVNIDVFIDRADIPNAPNGVYRAGIDTACMLLFGTVTKWHTQCWSYEGGKWQKGGTFPYLINRGTATLYIPLTVLPEDAIGVRFFTLTSDNAGHEAVDVAPGTGLPPLPEDLPQPTQMTPSRVSPPTSMGKVWSLILIVAAVAGTGAWAVSRRRKSDQ